MRAFVTKICGFFKLDTEKADDEKNFREGKRSLRIPLFQREYKWENEKISALISDIRRQRKFLGNIILDESAECHEIADGQQRITTCYLILVYLYNFYHGIQDYPLIDKPTSREEFLDAFNVAMQFYQKNDI